MSKLIKAVFTGRFCRTQRVFQWDTDDKLQIVNVDLPTNYTVDFSNSKTGDSVPVLATSDTVQIPPDLFVPGSEIYAWIWVSDSNGGHTPCEATIPIDPRARRTGTEPAPAQASAWDEAVDTLNETIEGIPSVINSALTEAKESGEFDGSDGQDGNGVWYVDVQYTRAISAGVQAQLDHMVGRPGATPAAGDLCVISDGRFGAVTSITPRVAVVPVLGDLSGTDGYSPTVTITEITGGHRVTITDEEHPDGQSFEVMDGQGGSGSDAFVVTYTLGQTSSCDKTYAEIMAAWKAGKTVIARGAGGTVGQTANVYAIQNISMVAILTLTAETVIRITHTSADTITWELLGIDATDIQGLDQYINGKGYYTKPAGGIPASDLASAVQTSLGKADTALQSAPVTSVNGQTGAVTLSIPTTAGDVGAIPAPSSPSSGDVLTYSGSAWAASEPHYIPAGGNSGAILAKSSASDYQVYWRTISDYTAAGIIITSAATAAKVCQYSFWDDTHYPQILYITLASANTSASALTMKVNGKGPYPIYINGAASSSTNYTLPAGAYLVLWDGTNFYFQTDGKIPSAMLPVYNGGFT